MQDKYFTLTPLVNKGVFQYFLYMYKITGIQIFLLSAFAFMMSELLGRIFEDKISIFSDLSVCSCIASESKQKMMTDISQQILVQNGVK